MKAFLQLYEDVICIQEYLTKYIYIIQTHYDILKNL